MAAIAKPILYHGSTAGALKFLFRGPGRLVSIYTELSHFSRRLMREYRDKSSPEEFANQMANSGASSWLAAATALINLSDGNDKTLFSYGAFYATLNARLACRYAYRGPELLTVVRAGLKLADSLSLPIGDDFDRAFPNLSLLGKADPSPVVLSLAPIDAGRITSESGDPLDWPRYVDIAKSGPLPFSGPFNVRIDAIGHQDIYRVVVLTDSTLEFCRLADHLWPSEWSLPRGVPFDDWLTSEGEAA